MYSHNQEQQHLPFHGAYRAPHQQQRWPDQSLNRPEFAILPQPSQGTMPTGRGGQSAPQAMIPREHQQTMDMQQQVCRNGPPNYHRHAPHHHPVHVPPHSRHHLLMRPGLVGPMPPPRNMNHPHNPPHSSSFNTTTAPSAQDINNNNIVDSFDSSQDAVQTPLRTSSVKSLSQRFNEQIDRSLLPLQTVDSNIRVEKSQTVNDKEKKEPPQKELTPATRNNQRKVEASSRAKFSVMSPISMCFSRMLGAAEMIKTPRDKHALENIRSTGSSVNMLASVPEIGSGGESEEDFGGGKSSTKKRDSIDSDTRSAEGTDLDDSNPFDELAADEELERLVVLQMAMQRHQIGGGLGQDDMSCFERDIEQKTPTSPKRPVSDIISEGFFWREYPTCEQVLYKHMERYYEVSAIQRNYKVQQSFNNLLVKEVRSAAETAGFMFEPSFDDKKLRDRIRCFYKTHLQNAKKRLATLQKHPDSLENQCLVSVYIRCVRDRTLSFQESLAMAPQFPKKRRRMDKVEKLKYDLAASDANFAAKFKSKKEKSNNIFATFQQQRFQKAACEAELRAKAASDRSAAFKQQEEEEKQKSDQEREENQTTLP